MPEDLAEFFSMVCRLGRRTRQRDEGPQSLQTQKCRSEPEAGESKAIPI